MSKRPVFLDLRLIHFPVTAIVSILHRISGVILFLAIPILLRILQLASDSATGFAAVADFFHRPWVIFIGWLLFVATLYHLLAGLKHLFSDCSLISESYRAGRISSWIVLILTVVIAVWCGAWWI